MPRRLNALAATLALAATVLVAAVSHAGPTVRRGERQFSDRRLRCVPHHVRRGATAHGSDPRLDVETQDEQGRKVGSSHL